MDAAQLKNLAYQSLLDLATPEGIHASAKSEVYGCIFGRDSAITILKILRAHLKNPTPKLLLICRRALLTLVALQGSQVNLESGEEPGKFIHEFRKDQQKDRLLKMDHPWFVYPDNTIKNYDSLDSTPLTLIALYKYWQISGDGKFLVSVLPAVEAGLNWLLSFGDIDKDCLLEYDLPKRGHGGLLVQSWTDSHESIKDEKGNLPKYPIAPIEVQAYGWLALKLWADYYSQVSPEFTQKLSSQADKMKRIFNDKFIFRSRRLFFGAQALDGDKSKIKTITGNPLICLWATYDYKGRRECILNESYIIDFVKRGFMTDLFDKEAGIRTMSTLSPTYNSGQDSYHNGSFWPVLNGLVHEGLEIWGFLSKAEMLKRASLLGLAHFGTPIELYTKDESGYHPYQSDSGQVSCQVQAWSAATALDLLT